ncbi:hypothetical protein BDQ12DRAFT_677662 [Crucibulum laeve]|uniref:Uncharacterized protein n=1 Tax=Crucibulum laeve TaxID=68775 RepID=A0A5C3ME40_9AGAR|nr:hypothetical protein BDQ12DRAFT_677662 [Crucibulum laeve]
MSCQSGSLPPFITHPLSDRERRMKSGKLGKLCWCWQEGRGGGFARIREVSELKKVQCDEGASLFHTAVNEERDNGTTERQTYQNQRINLQATISNPKQS